MSAWNILIYVLGDFNASVGKGGILGTTVQKENSAATTENSKWVEVDSTRHEILLRLSVVLESSTRGFPKLPDCHQIERSGDELISDCARLQKNSYFYNIQNVFLSE